MRTTPAIVLPGAPAPAEPFTVTAEIGLEDRIAAALFCYRDLFATGRRRMLHAFAWMMLMLVIMAGFQAWQTSGRDGIGAFASRFGSQLLGYGGLPLLVVAVLALAYALAWPAITRRRLRNWYRDEGLDRPFTGIYRFEPGGLISSGSGRSSATACRRIAGVTRAPEHLFIQLKDMEDAIALPLRTMDAEQAQRIEAWAGSCHAGAARAEPFPELAGEPAQEPILTARFVRTEADRVVELGWQMERPGMKRRRRRGFALAFVVTALIPPLLVALLWLIDPERVPLRHSFPLFVEMFATHFWKWVLGFWAVVAIVIAIHPRLRRMQARQIARQLQRRVQAYETEVRLFEDRFETVQDGLRNRFDRAGFARAERQKEHILLHRRGDEPLILPLRALEGDRLALFERIVDTHIGRGAG
ncbi:hypothetical protein [Bosea sp. (in: a-proteobacteria)]|uniref:hypothetical protein n=1 Tax=Bosea sp. (in: a-proteobacteria) TaxID=1871050 RepID=UPI0026055D61|nr:hypothetical protein [Bosea sp. (in: a-proteobacteria)]MCO5092457.1 hypothetical protein [Bosea sp. (in: a-proteobacteria)]